ncbi:hypothetical protein Tco_0984227, partial [Tanacetum coccineum]
WGSNTDAARILIIAPAMAKEHLLAAESKGHEEWLYSYSDSFPIILTCLCSIPQQLPLSSFVPSTLPLTEKRVSYGENEKERKAKK